MIILGLDIGSNSVGSAWVDTDRKEITVGASIFPAGVDETETKRGAPKNQKRRQTRSQRRSLARRAQRKHQLRALLTSAGLVPADGKAWDHEHVGPNSLTPWHLRRDGLERSLTPHEFGRVLVHMNQRRGALGVSTDPDDPDEGKVKEAIDKLSKELNGRTFGQFMADLMDERRPSLKGKKGTFYQDPVRNRRDNFEFHAARPLIRDEFHRLWDAQKSFGGPLARLLTNDLRRALDDPSSDETWRGKGVIFGQRRTYWKTGTLGRCDLEPTDHRCPIDDMHAQEYRVVETVNNIRITEGDQEERSLTMSERDAVKAALRQQKTGSVKTVRKALGIDKISLRKRDLPEDYYKLNIEKDKDREINTDRFYREIVHGVFGEERWSAMSEESRESVNRALLKFDPDNDAHAAKLTAGAVSWWGLDGEAVSGLVAAWKARPRTDKRLSLSLGAIRNLLPYMNRYDETARRWPTQIEARQAFAEDPDNDATPAQRLRYAYKITDALEDVLLRDVRGEESAFDKLLERRGLTKADRQYMRKHADLLPPAKELANPVVRKAIYEVRRHVNAYLRKFGRKPDRIVIELAREARQPETVRNRALALNRFREKARKQIIEQFELARLTPTQQNRAVERVILCRQQKSVCAYSGKTITERVAAKESKDLEVDHIVPLSRSQDNGLNNKVLCFSKANRDKGNQTPKEWLGEKPEAFAKLEQRLRHLKDEKGGDGYFRHRDNARKWENLHRDAPSVEDFTASQFTDTAYASKQVIEYLRDRVFAGDRDRAGKVIPTMGKYTAILRRDWGLLESGFDPKRGMVPPAEGETEHGERGRARKEKGKDRSDHHHHAIDALVIALTNDKRLQELGRLAKSQEEKHGAEGRWSSRRALSSPWATTQEFRQQVLDAVDKLVICHRPVKRRLVGAFHEETAYGPVLGSDTLFTNRIRAMALTPNHLRVPDAWDALSDGVRDKRRSAANRRDARRQLAAMVDPPPGKSGIVRDRMLRDQIRRCLRSNALDPDAFKKEEIKKLVESGKLRMDSGVPIKSVILLRTNTEPVIIPRKKWDSAGKKYVVDPDPRTARVYIGGNNHHLEIREDTRTGKWTGAIVTMFEAARRVRIEKRSVVERTERDGNRFVMSLSEGETIHARRKDRDADATHAVDYFVVAKLDRNRIHFAPHWDARRASEQDRWSVTPADLKLCEPIEGQPPYKVRVSPLGEVQPLRND